MEVRRYEEIDKIDSREWDSIVDQNHILNSYNYLKAVEYSRINHFRYNYFMFYDDEKLVAHAQVGILSFGLDAMATATFRKIFGYIRKIFPSFLQVKFIECGFSSALGNSLLVIEGNIGKILQLLDRELVQLAKDEKASFILIRDIYSHQKREYDCLTDLKYNCFQNLPNTTIHLHYETFDEYLNDLNRQSRRKIKKRLDIFRKANCTVREIYDFESIAGQVLDLWYQTFSRAKEGQREILNREYFQYMSSLLGQKSLVLLCEKDQKPIGFTMLLDSGNSMICTYCGLDYETSKSCYTYFILFYKSIEKAIQMGKKCVELGISSYTPKIEIGAIPDPLYIYGKSPNRLVNTVFVPLLKWMNISSHFQERAIFNENHYLHYDGHIHASIGNTVFDVVDIDSKELVVEGDKTIVRDKNLSITIFEEHVFTIIAKARLQNITTLAPEKYRISLKILDMHNDYFLRWSELARHFSFKKGKKTPSTEEENF